MNRKRILLFVGIFVLVLVLLFRFFSSRKTAYDKVCSQFIGHIAKGDASASYGLFTSEAKVRESTDGWKEKVALLQPHYTGDPVLKRVATTEEVAIETAGSLQLEYELKNKKDKRIAINCFVRRSDNNYLVSGFSSR